jgi:RNA polymerase sigma factor (sigma-70 family)
VISYVKKYQGRGLNLAELVCIGNEGLLKAVKKFDPDRGVKFISYAVWWIRQTVLQALAEQTRAVRIPLNQNSNLVKMSRTETALTQKLGRSPADWEIANEVQEPVETVRALRRVASAELSLDAPLDKSDRDSASFGDRFSGAHEADIEVDVESQARREFLEKLFDKYLTQRERKILVLYYGLDDGEEMTLEQIGSLSRSGRSLASPGSESARFVTVPSTSCGTPSTGRCLKGSGALPPETHTYTPAQARLSIGSGSLQNLAYPSPHRFPPGAFVSCGSRTVTVAVTKRGGMRLSWTMQQWNGYWSEWP